MLKTDCVPGRKGCVLRSTSKFLIPADERVRVREQSKMKSSCVVPESKGRRDSD